MLTRALRGAAAPLRRRRCFSSANPFAAARKRGGRSGRAAADSADPEQSDQQHLQQRSEDVKKRAHDPNLTERFSDLEDYLREVLVEKTREDRGFSSPSQAEWNEMEAEALTRWAEANGYTATAVVEPEPEDGEEPVAPGDVAESGSAGDIHFEKAFDNFHDYEAMFDDVAEEEDPKEFMFNAPDADSARSSTAALKFSAESRALLDDILEGASADARKSIEQLVHSTYGPTAAANYLENMRTPRMPENCIEANHWAAPLLHQYLRVLDANPHYTPKQIETLLKQFGRELSTDYYKDEPFELDDGTVIDDVPKDEDEEDEDDGYLN